jgi:hypothetical protein
LAAIESKLAELDDLFLQFCSQQDYRFSRSLNIWPKRRVWRRQEIDRVMDLEMDVRFQEALDRGFYPEFPWSFHARGSLHPGTDPDVHILSRPIFEHVPYPLLASALSSALANGLQILNAMTESDILSRGKTARGIQLQGQAEYEAYVRAQESARQAEPGGCT